MPLMSMTGYATRSGEMDGTAWTWEIRSVNGRGLDLRVRLPEGAEGLEVPLRAAAKAELTRGHVTISLRTSRSRGQEVGASDAAIAQTLRMINRVETQATRDGLRLAPSTAADIVALAATAGGRPEEEGQSWLAAAKAQIADLLDALVAARAEEGAALSKVLEGALNTVSETVETAAEQARLRPQDHRDALSQKVSALLGPDAEVDRARLEQEVALLAVKVDVTEEIDRLRAHLTAASGLLQSSGPVGRKFDFLMQEFNREANTLCSKSNDTALTATGLELKVIIDQMREQVQNIE
ncbi:MAG: YicC/YloC family endoribonuclease [Pseudomonadota bacterium]